MLTSGFNEDVALVNGAASATALFGTNGKAAKIRFNRLRKSVHPDMNGGSMEAEEAFKRLNRLWDEYCGRPSGMKRPPELTRNGAYAVLDDGGSWLVVERMANGRIKGLRNGTFLSDVLEGGPACVFNDVEGMLIAQPDGDHAAYRCEFPDKVGRGRKAVTIEHLNGILKDGTYHPADLAWVTKRVIYLAAAMSSVGVEFAREPSECLVVAPDAHLLCVMAPWELRDSDGGIPSQRRLVSSFAECVRGSVGTDKRSVGIMRFIDGTVRDGHAESCDILREFDGFLYGLFGKPKWHEMETK